MTDENREYSLNFFLVILLPRPAMDTCEGRLQSWPDKLTLISEREHKIVNKPWTVEQSTLLLLVHTALNLTIINYVHF